MYPLTLRFLNYYPPLFLPDSFSYTQPFTFTALSDPSVGIGALRTATLCGAFTVVIVVAVIGNLFISCDFLSDLHISKQVKFEKGRVYIQLYFVIHGVEASEFKGFSFRET